MLSILSILLLSSTIPLLIQVCVWLIVAILVLVVVWLVLSLISPTYAKFRNILFALCCVLAVLLLISHFGGFGFM